MLDDTATDNRIDGWMVKQFTYISGYFSYITITSVSFNQCVYNMKMIILVFFYGYGYAQTEIKT